MERVFFFIQFLSFFTPYNRISECDRDISNYTLNQIISTHKRCALGIKKNPKITTNKKRRSNQEGGSLQAKKAHTLYVRNHEDLAAGSALAEEMTSLCYGGVMYISDITRGVSSHMFSLAPIYFPEEELLLLLNSYL